MVNFNTVIGNDVIGLSLQSGSGYANNVITGNNGGTVSGGIQTGANVCDGDTTCP